MKRDFVFSYRYFEVPHIGKVFYPLITVSLKTIDAGPVDFEFLVDTGADLTTMPNFIAQRLGIDLAKAEKSKSCGIGGFTVATWIVKVVLYIKGVEFPVRASITAENQTPFLLGRVDLLDGILSWYFDSAKEQIRFRTL